MRELRGQGHIGSKRQGGSSRPVSPNLAAPRLALLLVAPALLLIGCLEGGGEPARHRVPPPPRSSMT